MKLPFFFKAMARNPGGAGEAHAVAGQHHGNSGIELIERDLSRSIASLAEGTGAGRDAVEATSGELDRAARLAREIADDANGGHRAAMEIAAAIGKMAKTSAGIGEQAVSTCRGVERLCNTAVAARGDATLLTEEIMRITMISEAIEQIADRINMLALNATIEAARAGDAGRGFSVVATEVKALARQTHKLTGDIATQIGAVTGAATRTEEAVAMIEAQAADLNGIARSSARAAEEQADTSQAIDRSATRLTELTRAIDERGQKIAEASQRARQTGDVALERAHACSGHVIDLGRMIRVALRTTASGDRRADDRLPKELAVTIPAGGHTRTIDISAGGTLIASSPAMDRMVVGSEFRVRIDRIGEVGVKVVTRSDLGLHCTWTDMDNEVRERLDGVLADIRAEDAQFAEQARTIADRVEEALHGLVETGRLSLDDLFDDEYISIPGTNPRQHRTRYLESLEKVLPPILEEPLSRSRDVVFCAAVDRNGYLPVHNRRYSHEPGNDPAWNAAHCRNRRIFNDRAGFAAARNTRPQLVQAYARDMGNGNTVMLKEIDVPLTIAERHWGALRFCFRL
ncbi:MAG: PilZ domain-containing protein [Geminicoccaceae bacterium]|nr:PilZ domain-containing protein [Geminicoccaceae bacterium]